MNYFSRSLHSLLLKITTVAVVLSGLLNALSPVAAQAATLTSLSMTLATSAPATVTNVRVIFTTVAQISGDTTASDDDGKIIVRLPTAATDPFTISASLVSGDIALVSGFGTVTVNSVTLSNRGGSAANDTITIGLNQTVSGAAVNIAAGTALTFDILNNRITNPAKVAAAGTADIWQVSFATQDNGASSDLDTGATQVATVDTTAATATVNTTLTFVVAAVANGTSTFGIVTDAASTPTTVPFGTLAPNSAKEVAQQLTITTNAPAGYLVYITENANLTAGGNDIDQFKDGVRVDDSANTAWTSPAVVASSEATQGHFGYGTTDTTVFTNNQYAGVPDTNAASAAPITTGLACDNTVATTGDTCNVVYKVEISALQEAGSYSNTLTYIVVPRY